MKKDKRTMGNTLIDVFDCNFSQTLLIPFNID